MKTSKLFSRTFEFFRKDTQLVVGCLVLSVFCAILPLILPVLEGIMLGRIFDQNKALLYAGWLFGIGVITQIGFWLSNFFVSKLSTSVEKRVKLEMLGTLSKLRIKSIASNGCGSITTRLNDSCEQLSKLYAEIFASIAQIFSNAAFLIFIMVANHWLGLYTLLGIFLLFALEFARISVWTKGNKKIFEQNDAVATLSNEMIEGAGDIKALGNHDYALAGVGTELEKFRKLKFVEEQKQNGFSLSSSVLNLFLSFGFVLLSVMLIRDGKLLISTFFIVYIYRTHSNDFVESLATLGEKLSKAKLASSRVVDVVDGNRKFLHQEFGTVQIVDAKGKIEIANVAFAYHYKRPVLKNISLKIAPNSLVALTGESGCGKSTLLKLVSGELVPQRGSILIDGANIKDLSQKAKEKAIFHILAQPYFFSGSIRENLLRAKPNATFDELVLACKKASVFDDISMRPSGFSTEIKKQTLSSGELKRLAIARAILKNSKIILIDEPTQNLDEKNQKQVIETIVKLSKHHTVVVATHDSKLVQVCHQVFEIRNGKIISQH